MSWPYPHPDKSHETYPWWQKNGNRYLRYDGWKITTSSKTKFIAYNPEGVKVEEYDSEAWSLEEIMEVIDDNAPSEKPRPFLLQLWQEPDGDIFKIDGISNGTPFTIWPEAGLGGLIKKWTTWPPPECRLVSGRAQWGEDCRWAPH